MVQPAADAAAIRRADDHRHGPLAVGAVAHFGSFVDDLVESRVNKVGELDFADRAHAIECRADADADNGGFGQRRIDHALAAVFFEQAHCCAEHAAALAHVFADDKHVLVARQFFIHGLADGFDQGNFSHGAPPRRTRERRHLPAQGKAQLRQP